MTTIDLGYSYDKLLTSLRGFYQGSHYYGALIMLDRAREVHSGKRKNGFPEFSHQLMQATYLRTIQAGVMYPEAMHIVVLAHDMDEDYGVTPEENCKAIKDGCPVHWSGWKEFQMIEPAMDAMNKKKFASPEAAFRALARDPIAGPCKGLDRDHNISSMPHAFAPPKQREYIAETRELILPMLKAGRKLYPAQAPIYHNLAHQIRMKIMLIEHHLNHPQMLDPDRPTFNLDH